MRTKTYDSTKARYKLDPSRFGDIIEALSDYSRHYAQDVAKRDNPHCNDFIIYLSGRRSVVSISTHRVTEPGTLGSIDLATLRLRKDGSLEFKVFPYEAVVVPSDRLHEIGRKYAVKARRKIK